jgi:hypothetical protein
MTKNMASAYTNLDEWLKYNLQLLHQTERHDKDKHPSLFCVGIFNEL